MRRTHETLGRGVVESSSKGVLTCTIAQIYATACLFDASCRGTDNELLVTYPITLTSLGPHTGGYSLPSFQRGVEKGGHHVCQLTGTAYLDMPWFTASC
jgi:hypothetical protein